MTESTSGLTAAEALRRLALHGKNELTGTGVRSPWRIIWSQLTSIMVVILLAAGAISAVLGDYKDAIAIGAIVALNTILGFTQEYRAEKAMEALKKLAVPVVRVMRDGSIVEEKASNLVPGDLILLEAGNLVAADCRVTESVELQTQEAALTGESVPVQKHIEEIAFMGTFISSGRGRAVVVQTGMHTELGRIATLIQTVDQEPTPLQRRLNQLGGRLALVALLLVTVIVVLGAVRGMPHGESWKLLFLTAVSVGVAAVPEGLPAVVTIALTLGAQRMLQRNVLIRKLPAVETLGSVTVICSDKTGTLTQNRMTAVSLHASGTSLDLNGTPAPDPRFGALVAAAALCNDAEEKIGDPTEIALIVAASRFGFSKEQLNAQFPRVAEKAFTSERKRMTTVHRLSPEATLFGSSRSGYISITKGAPEILFDPKTFDKNIRKLAEDGLRLIGVGYRWVESPAVVSEDNLTFLGVIALADPPRPEAAKAVAMCKAAGITPIMITGDHHDTALNIARQLGIADDAVHARVSPSDKLRIVEKLQQQGQIVAMTGDGVNDAPALKRADIGIAMGVSGTDVAKEAADMVLLDDNFATIVAAVEEGRVIYDNIRKFVKYILATNSGEIWLMLLAPILGMPLPLLPLQILWMNLVTDGLPALALGWEPPESNAMRRLPHAPTESIFSRGLGRHVIWVGLLMGLLSLGTGYWLWSAHDSHWRTIVFTAMTLSQMAHVMAIRSEHQSLFTLGIWTNKPLLAAVALTLVLQMALVYLPPLQDFFQTQALPWQHLLLAFALSGVVFWAVELEKWVSRKGMRSGG